jgi:hypothetical protein
MVTLRQRVGRAVFVGTLIGILSSSSGTNAVRASRAERRSDTSRRSASPYPQVQPGRYPAHSAAWTLAQFLNGWRDENWNAMACVSRGDITDTDADEVRCEFELHVLLGARIEAERPSAPTEIRYGVTVWYRDLITNSVKQAHLRPDVVRLWGRWGVKTTTCQS